MGSALASRLREGDAAACCRLIAVRALPGMRLSGRTVSRWLRALMPRIASRLIILILVVFAVLVTIVSLALCTFHIRNIVETDRTDMGVLKALGYTGQMISHR